MWASWNILLMRTFLARCSTLGVLAGGFMLTGDAGWVIARGTSLLNATNIPASPSGEAPTQPPAPPPVEAFVHPTLAQPPVPPPADGGLSAIDLRLLRPGDRLLVWVMGSPTAFDLVDPATGEAIQQPQTRRVRISGADDGHRLVRGGVAHVQPLAGISGHLPAAERFGPVQAIVVK